MVISIPAQHLSQFDQKGSLVWVQFCCLRFTNNISVYSQIRNSCLIVIECVFRRWQLEEVLLSSTTTVPWTGFASDTAACKITTPDIVGLSHPMTMQSSLLLNHALYSRGGRKGDQSKCLTGSKGVDRRLAMEGGCWPSSSDAVAISTGTACGYLGPTFLGCMLAFCNWWNLQFKTRLMSGFALNKSRWRHRFSSRARASSLNSHDKSPQGTGSPFSWSWRSLETRYGKSASDTFTRKIGVSEREKRPTRKSCHWSLSLVVSVRPRIDLTSAALELGIMVFISAIMISVTEANKAQGWRWDGYWRRRRREKKKKEGASIGTRRLASSPPHAVRAIPCHTLLLPAYCLLSLAGPCCH